MEHEPLAAALLVLSLVSADTPPVATDALDPVLARVYKHAGAAPRPLVQVVGPIQMPDLWSRVKDLVAFRIHRSALDGTTTPDPTVYLVRDSTLYLQAAESLRSGVTQKEYLWCLLAAVIAHEAAHVAPLTERAALAAELAELQRCLQRGHLHTSTQWSAVAYLGKVEAKLRNPREHY